MPYEIPPAMARLVDGNLENPVNGQLAQYDSATGLWELIATSSLVGQVLAVAAFRGAINIANGVMGALIDLTAATYGIYAGTGIGPDGGGGLLLAEGNYLAFLSTVFGITAGPIAGLPAGGYYQARANNLGLAARSLWAVRTDLADADLIDASSTSAFTVAAQPYGAQLINDNASGSLVAGTYSLTVLRVVS